MGEDDFDLFLFRQKDRVALSFAIGDLAIAAKLIQKGHALGMAEASRLLRGVWNKVRNREKNNAYHEEEWKKVRELCIAYSADYEKRAQEVGPKIIEIKRGYVPMEVG